MKKILLLITIVLFNYTFSQENKVKTFRFNPKISLGFHTQNFIGDNYLTKGHSNPAIGIETDFQIFSFKKINTGFGIKRVGLNVTDKSIGGNIDRTNINSIHVFLSYDLLKINKFNIIPEVQFGGLELRQKGDGNSYGVQNGNFYNFSVNINYKINKYLHPYFKIGFDSYLLKTNTTDEFKSYFNRSNSLNLSLGIQFL